jgi:hypothetical protein
VQCDCNQNSLALALGAPPDEATAALVAKNLAEDVMSFGNKTTTGVVGIAFLFPMLDKYGYGDVGLATLLNDDYPSLGHMAHQNMTTLCENFACTFHEAGGGSQNHVRHKQSDAIMCFVCGRSSLSVCVRSCWVAGTRGCFRLLVASTQL